MPSFLTILLLVSIGCLVNAESAPRADNAHQASNSHSLGHDDDMPEKFVVTHEAWFNISISDNKFSPPTRTERIVIALFGEICPMTVTNFITITKGLRRPAMKYSYKGTPVHRIVRDFVVQTGDFTNGDGTGGKEKIIDYRPMQNDRHSHLIGKIGKSIYGDKFIDENYFLSHRSPGWVSMANYGKDTNGSQWFITLVPARWLDGHHVAFGRVVYGMDFLYELGEMETFKGTSIPKKHIVIEDCGLFDISKYELTHEQLGSYSDIVTNA